MATLAWNYLNRVKSIDRRLHVYLIGLLIFTCSFLFYIWFYNAFSMSMKLTANGVWKSIDFAEYVHNNGVLETGNILYYPLLEVISRFLGLSDPMEYYVMIVMINGFCSSLVLAGIFVFFHTAFKDISLAFTMVAVHFLCSGAFGLSISNEDILPSYTLYVFSAFSFYFYLKNRKTSCLILTSLLMSFSMLLHWTSGLPAFGALFIYLLFLNEGPFRDRIRYFLLALSIPAGIFLAVSYFIHFPYLDIWYPAKASNSLWISGISLDKIPIVIVNTCSFFLTGIVIRQMDSLPVIVILSTLLIALPVCISMVQGYLSLRKTPLGASLQLIHFLVIVFVIGTGMTYFEQASDPQFFIQTQFLFIFMMAVIYLRHKRSKLLTGSILFCFAVANAMFILRSKNWDDYRFNNIQAVERQVKDHNKTLFISQGFETFNALATLKWGGKEHFHYLFLPEGLRSELEMTDEAYVKYAQSRIREYTDRGFQLVMIGFVNTDPQTLGTLYTGFDLTSKMTKLQQYFKATYNFEEIEGTHKHTFFILHPKSSDQHNQ